MNYCQQKNKAQEINSAKGMRRKYQRQELDVTHTYSEKQQY
jgi:hypothetical protein